MIDTLQPDIILISISQHWLKQLKLINKAKFKIFDKKSNNTNRNKPYTVYQYDYLLNNDRATKVYFGQAAQKPFGTLSNKFKGILGKEILDKYVPIIQKK